MKPEKSFLNKRSTFWASVKYASETLGYSQRKRKQPSILKHYSCDDLSNVLSPLNVSATVISEVCDYLNFRTDLINNSVSPLLMDKAEAKEEFEKLLQSYSPTCHLPMNKQKGEKRHHSYFTCIINMLTEKTLQATFDSNPKRLAIVTNKEGKLIKTFSRRLDGAFPTLKNPHAIWEVKEYYGTTSFGSRVADGVYETIMDGYEIAEAEAMTSIAIEHYLFVDDRFTWWIKGKSYLCRLIDIMHHGYATEVIFGKEVFTRWPEIVKSWK